MKPRKMIERMVPLDDIEIVRGGDGRTVRAYAATFDTPYEVRDQYGHYDEVLNRAAFNRTLSSPHRKFQVLFNHGRNLEGQPSDRYSMPLGTPLEVTPDGKGLLTVTRYAKTPLADEVLELVREGAITSQSFRGAIIRNARAVPGPNGRPVVERLELGLKDYGPAPFAMNTGAEILSVRSQVDMAVDLDELFEQIEQLEPQDRDALAARLAPVTLDPDQVDDSTEPDTQPAAGPSVDVLIAANANRRRRLA